MPDLVLELYSEDIPAWMQDSAVRTLARGVNAGLAGAEVSGAVPESFATPRRLALIIRDLPNFQPARTRERKGPRTNAPSKAIEGFLRSAGVQSLSDLETRNDGKSDFYVAVTSEEARPLSALLASIIPDVLHNFPWPKSMRWGEGNFRWVRPLRSVLCLFNGEIVPFEVAGIASGNTTQGHPVMAPNVISINGAQDYLEKMCNARVILDAMERRKCIRDQLSVILEGSDFYLVEDELLLIETAGQVEWPVVTSGLMYPVFMSLPEELLISVMRGHQQNFAFRDKRTGKIAPSFAAVADVEAPGRSNAIIAGNEAVLRARFADAQFYWEVDCKRGLREYKKKSDSMVFHTQLGSVGDKVERLEAMWENPDMGGASRQVIKETLPFLKSDLATGTVQEFPELQGVVGCYLALKDKELGEEHAAVIREHYSPMGPDDAIPSSEAGQWAALMDKLDTLVSFFVIGESPSGSGDPHGLRRAALGILRILLEGKINFPESLTRIINDTSFKSEEKIGKGVGLMSVAVLGFMAERLRVHLRNNRGMPHDVIDAVLFPSGEGREGGIDSPRRSVLLMEELAKFLGTDDGANLLAGYKRAANILRIEEKKDSAQYAPAPDSDLLREGAEKTLAKTLEVAEKDTATTLDQDDFAAAMTALAKLRQPLDAFFDSVTVNDSDKNLRANRLKLLSQVREVMHQVADFSRIEGGERKQS